MKRPGVLSAVLVTLGAIAAPGMLAAAPATTAVAAGHPDPRIVAARIACDSGDPDRGVALLAQIAAEKGDVNALFNEARCYQQNGRLGEALEHFKEYRRRAKTLSPDEAQQVDGYIRELEAELARKEQPVAPSPVAPAPVPVAPPASPPAPSPVPGPPGDNHLRVAGVVVGGVGVAALLTGVYFSLKVRSLNDELGAPTPLLTKDQYRDKKSQGEDAAKYQWIGYGVGAAALTGAAVLLLLGHDGPAGDEPARVSVLPTLAPGVAGGVVHLRW